MLYEFSYRDTGDNIFSGRLVGDLQPDMDTVIVSSVFDLRHSLFDTIGLEYETALFPGYDRVSLSGMAMRFGSIGPGQGSSKVYWAFGDFLQPLSDAQLFIFSAGTAGAGSEQRNFFLPSRWEVEAVGRIPLPGSLGLVVLGVGLVFRNRHSLDTVNNTMGENIGRN
jgi:hypothetical protein